MDPSKVLNSWLDNCYDEIHRRVTRCANGDPGRAQDALQEIMQRLLATPAILANLANQQQNCPPGTKPCSESPLARFVIVAACREARRSFGQGEETPGILPEAVDEEDPAASLLSVERQALLAECLGRLDCGNRLAVLVQLKLVDPEGQPIEIPDWLAGLVEVEAVQVWWVEMSTRDRTTLWRHAMKGIADLRRCLIQRNLDWDAFV